jgi:ABC-type bacteriocin/lantibiotic exporter with double-glycine peptidase domain
MINVPVLRQPSDHECGNTCLAAVAQYFGKPVSIAEMKQLARTTEAGTDHEPMIEAARATGATVYAAAGGTLDDIAGFLARGLPVIVGWWSECGHFSVICGVSDGRVVLMDPEAGIVELAAEAFEQAWFDTDTDEDVRVDRWYLVLDYAPPH